MCIVVAFIRSFIHLLLIKFFLSICVMSCLSQVAEGDLKLMVLALDIFTSFTLSIISNVQGSTEGVNGTSSEVAIASVVVFPVVSSIYIAITLVYYSCKC